MTEAEWLACENPIAVFARWADRVSGRKKRLFAVACCRRVWRLLTDERSRRAVDRAEHDADEAVPELAMLSRNAEDVYPDALTGDEEDAECPHCPGATNRQWVAACSATSLVSFAPVIRDGDVVTVMNATSVATGNPSAERIAQTILLRELIGNPFRPITFASEWRTDTTIALARQMYDAREFYAMPILADALQDAGCDNEAILSHCRSDGPHVRGCWVVDSLLGKE